MSYVFEEKTYFSCDNSALQTSLGKEIMQFQTKRKFTSSPPVRGEIFRHNTNIKSRASTWHSINIFTKLCAVVI